METKGRLTEKVAIVTGAGQGIGRGIALVYAREGARVVVAEIDEAACNRTVEEIAAAGGEALGLPTDVGLRAEVTAMVEETVQRFGRIDVLVNNAQSFGRRHPFEDIPDEQFDRVWTSGVKGTFWAMKAAFPHMKRQGGGRIINFVSLAGVRGDPGFGDYNATKEGIRALTRTAAREWAGYGILVNAIAPSAWTRPAQEYAAADPEGFQQMLSMVTPMARMGDPEADIAPVAVFLASDDSRFMTGETFFVDGGTHTAA